MTFGSVTTEFDGGYGHVILTYYDGTKSRFDNDDIQNDLNGTTHSNVVSVEIYIESGMPRGVSWHATINRTLGQYEYSGFIYQGGTYITNTACPVDVFLYPEEDLVITVLYLSAYD